MSKPNHFNRRNWKDSFEEMRLQSEKIRKATGMSDRLQQDYRDMVEATEITDNAYQTMMRDAARKYADMQLDELKQQRSSSKVKKLNLAVKDNPNSTASRISVILKQMPEGLHITKIMEELAKRDQLSKSVYHRYSHISGILNSNYLLFEKIGPATFKARDMLPWENVDAPKKTKAKKPEVALSPSFKDLILWAAKKWAKELGNSPRNITDALNLAGIDVAYNTVKKVLIANKSAE